MTRRTRSPPNSPDLSPRTFSCPYPTGTIRPFRNRQAGFEQRIRWPGPGGGLAMTSRGEAAFDAHLPAGLVLGQAEIGVVVADRLGNLLFLNEYAVRLCRITGDVSPLAGASVLSLGLF